MLWFKRTSLQTSMYHTMQQYHTSIWFRSQVTFSRKVNALTSKLQQLILYLQDSQSSIMAFEEHPLVLSNKLFFKTVKVSQLKSHWHSSTRHTHYCQIETEKEVNTFTKTRYLLLIKEHTMTSSLTTISRQFCFINCSHFQFILFCWSERHQNSNLIQVTAMQFLNF